MKLTTAPVMFTRSKRNTHMDRQNHSSVTSSPLQHIVWITYVTQSIPLLLLLRVVSVQGVQSSSLSEWSPLRFLGGLNLLRFGGLGGGSLAFFFGPSMKSGGLAGNPDNKFCRKLYALISTQFVKRNMRKQGLTSPIIESTCPWRCTEGFVSP